MLSSPENPEEEKQAARNRVAEMARDVEEEHEVLCALGLM
jgi:hypothetical protein